MECENKSPPPPNSPLPPPGDWSLSQRFYLGFWFSLGCLFLSFLFSQFIFMLTLFRLIHLCVCQTSSISPPLSLQTNQHWPVDAVYFCWILRVCHGFVKRLCSAHFHKNRPSISYMCNVRCCCCCWLYWVRIFTRPTGLQLLKSTRPKKFSSVPLFLSQFVFWRAQ